jgi:hypothetical protein
MPWYADLASKLQRRYIMKAKTNIKAGSPPKMKIGP